MAEKTKFRYYTIADFEDEEKWLEEEHRKGWKLNEVTFPGIYHFTECEPADAIYRMDFQNDKESDEYKVMCRDYGWHYISKFSGWLYFRKDKEEVQTAEDGELFSDRASMLEMITRVMKNRLVPLLLIFLVCVIPNFYDCLKDGRPTFFMILWSFLFIIYIIIGVHCFRKLNRMRKELEQ